MAGSTRRRHRAFLRACRPGYPGDVAYVPAGSDIRLDGGPGGGAAWTTSLAGLEATMSDGSLLRPPWTL
jgi:hypothetical protein